MVEMGVVKFSSFISLKENWVYSYLQREPKHCGCC